MHPGRTAGIGGAGELLSAPAPGIIADDQVAGEQIDLFPILVHKRFGRVRAGGDPQQPGATALLVLFIQPPGQNFFGEARRVPGRRRESCREIHRRKLVVRFVDAHGSSSYPSTGNCEILYTWLSFRPRTGSSNSMAKTSAGSMAPLTARVPQNMAYP